MHRQADILTELTELFREIFVNDEITLTPQTSAADLPGWDSMKHIEIIIAIEQKYAIRFSSRQVEALRSVGDLVAAIDQKLT
ncbi:MAG: acyl carrier protein [Pseudomonadota bacterium]|nr:acyl carrier protein [Pseudomonadota bacterium]